MRPPTPQKISRKILYVISEYRPPEHVAILHTSLASPIRRLAWLVPQLLVIFAVSKALELIDIDKLDAIAVRQLDEAEYLELAERATHGL